MSMAEQMAAIYGVPDCPCCGAAPQAGFRGDDFVRDLITVSCTVCTMLGTLEDWRRQPPQQQDAHVFAFYRTLAKLHELIDGYLAAPTDRETKTPRKQPILRDDYADPAY